MMPEGVAVDIYDADGNWIDRDGVTWVTYEDDEGREWVRKAWGLNPGERLFIDGQLSYTQGNEPSDD